MYQVHMKLKALKPQLRKLNQRVYNDISGRVIQAKADLVTHQLAVLSGDNSAAMRQNERDLLATYIELSKTHEGFYRQKAKIKRLQGGAVILPSFSGKLI